MWVVRCHVTRKVFECAAHSLSPYIAAWRVCRSLPCAAAFVCCLCWFEPHTNPGPNTSVLVNVPLPFLSIHSFTRSSSSLSARKHPFLTCVVSLDYKYFLSCYLPGQVCMSWGHYWVNDASLSLHQYDAVHVCCFSYLYIHIPLSQGQQALETKIYQPASLEWFSFMLPLWLI